MNLTELSSPSAASLPVRALADQLRLGSGFADDGTLDPLLEALLDAAIAAIEARIGKVLLEKTYALEVTRWLRSDRYGLPLGPVSAINAVTLIDSQGRETSVEADRYTLWPDLYRPEIRASALPTIPTRGAVRIAFVAGFGPNWGDLPSDLQHAVLMLAASYYQNRAGAGSGDAFLPFGVLALIERYRTVRLTGDVA